MTTLERGQQVEHQACAFLQQKGLHLLMRNYRCRLGEIDLIMQDKQTLVFVEVRYRRQTTFGSGIESVTWHKQQKLIRAAEFYLQHHHPSDTLACRFDVIAYSDTTHEPITWIQDAFGVN